MPDRETIERARKDAREGKSVSTQAGEFVREEVHHVRQGKHGVHSPQQAIAIGLSKARRAGIKLGVPKGSASLRKKTAQDIKAGEHPQRKTYTTLTGNVARPEAQTRTKCKSRRNVTTS
jgi:hypothetical protein